MTAEVLQPVADLIPLEVIHPDQLRHLALDPVVYEMARGIVHYRTHPVIANQVMTAVDQQDPTIASDPTLEKPQDRNPPIMTTVTANEVTTTRGHHANALPSNLIDRLTIVVNDPRETKGRK